MKYPKFELSIWYFSVLFFWLPLLEIYIAAQPGISGHNLAGTVSLLKMARTLVLGNVPCASAQGVLHLTGNCYSSLFSSVLECFAGLWVLSSVLLFFLKTNSYYMDPGFFLEVSPSAAIAALTL